MNDKKQRLIDTALQLFYESGVNSVGINEVLKVSGVAKKTLYNHFKSKEDLIIATLKARDHVFLEWLEAALQDAQTNTDIVTRLFHALAAWFHNEVPQLSRFRGCFFINTAAEFSGQNSDIPLYCRQHKHQVRQLIQRHMPTEDEDLLNMICFLKEGAIISAFVNQDSNAANQCLALLLKYLTAKQR